MEFINDDYSMYETILCHVINNFEIISTSYFMEFFKPENNNLTRLYITKINNLELAYMMSIAFTLYLFYKVTKIE